MAFSPNFVKLDGNFISVREELRNAFVRSQQKKVFIIFIILPLESRSYSEPDAFSGAV